VTVRTPVYVAVALGQIAFGVLGMFSVGVPLFLTGVAMLAVLPWRHRRGVVMAAIIAPWAFVFGYVLVAPLGCTAAGTGAPGLDETATTCTNVLGIGYSGGAEYRPPLMPGVAAGLGLAAIALLVLRAAVQRRP
jgi:hypothetical protein